MIKSSSLVFVLLFAFVFRLETFSMRLIGVIALICVGVLLMVASETQFVLGGFLLCLSGSALAGLRWSLTQLLLKNKKLGLDHPVATIFWLSPIMGITVAIVSASIDRWSDLVGSRFFDGPAATLLTCFLLTVPGVLAFCMILSEYLCVYQFQTSKYFTAYSIYYSIILRAGVVPMSIAGIAKEVSTITLAAWFFGDELTPLNITGVAITICGKFFRDPALTVYWLNYGSTGIALFTYHKYRKSIDSTLPLDAHGNPIEDYEDDLVSSHHLRVMDLEDTEERRPLAASLESRSQVDDLPVRKFSPLTNTTRILTPVMNQDSEPPHHQHHDTLFDADLDSDVDVSISEGSIPTSKNSDSGVHAMVPSLVGNTEGPRHGDGVWDEEDKNRG